MDKSAQNIPSFLRDADGLGAASVDVDNWRDRSDMVCKTCMYYVGKGHGADDVMQSIGRCRRHAPTVNGYPVVFSRDWCGDHKLDADKFVRSKAGK